MSRVTYSAFRENLAAFMDEVSENRTELHVTRQGASSVVVMAEEEFDSIQETLHLLRSPANARRLLNAVADADAGKVTEFDPTK
jgi:antitoxin YefM